MNWPAREGDDALAGDPRPGVAGVEGDRQQAGPEIGRADGADGSAPGAHRWLSAVAVAALVFAAVGVSERTAALDRGAQTREEALTAIRERVLESQRQLEELEAVEVSVEAQLRRIALELDLQRQLLSQAVAERELAEQAVRESQERSKALAEKLAATRARLRVRLLALDRAAPADWLRGFLTVRAPEDFFLYVRTLRFLARRDARLVPQFRQAQADLDEGQRLLVQRGEEVARSVALERSRLADLEAAKRRQSLVIQALERERTRIESEAKTLDVKERKLSLLIAVFSSPDGPSLSGKPIQDFYGALDWPMSGTVSIPFGPRFEARYGTSVPHNGIRIDVSGDDEVRAVFPGEVIFAAPFEGFGLTAVVHHPSDVFSLYAGLERLEVSQGDVVVLAQPLGVVSSALYFEIRVANRPEDPMNWLR